VKEGLGVPDFITKRMPKVARSRGHKVDREDSSLQVVSSILNP